MQTTIKQANINPATSKRKPGKIWLIISVIFFILLFVPDPGKFIPVFGEGEELLEGGISISALLVYMVRYWLYKNIKEQITGK